MGIGSVAARFRVGMAGKMIAMSVSGVLALGACVLGSAKYVLDDGATQAARRQVDANMRVAWETLKARGTTFAVVDGALKSGDHPLVGDTAVVDKVKELVGGTATIFQGDTRVATNVIKPDGSRATGTTLARTEAYASVFDRKTPFRGEVPILGEPYMTAYDPILGADGSVVGVLYVGIKKADFL